MSDTLVLDIPDSACQGDAIESYYQRLIKAEVSVRQCDRKEARSFKEYRRARGHYEDSGEIHLFVRLYTEIIEAIGWDRLDGLFEPNNYTITTESDIRQLMDMLREARAQLQHDSTKNWELIEYRHTEHCEFAIEQGYGLTLSY